MIRSRIFLTALLAALPLCSSVRAAGAAPCTGPEWRQLDFWVGDWDATWPASPGQAAGRGTNHIRKVLGGCVIEENFDGGGAQPLKGKSVSMYVPQVKAWRQTWVDDQGSYLALSGGIEDGHMTLGMERPAPDGGKVLVRMVFTDVKPDSFDWRWESSKDGGKTWNVQWPIHYTRAKTLAER
jgi:uncharacterized protein DUF1579